MGFDRRENARPYTPTDGDTLQRIAERERAAGNPVTWQDIARFNWGTDDPREVDACLRDELGCRARDAANHFVISADDEPRGELLIPVPFRQPDLAVGRTYTLHVRRRRCPPQFVACCSLPSVTFAFDSSFVRPAVAGHLHRLATLATAHPTARIMIFGHTDAVGDEPYNKRLSERRAWSVHAFVTNDVAAWETLYGHADERWGVPVLQEILADLGHDPGPVDGDWGALTRAAAAAFLGLPEGAPVENDAPFRARLFAAYMASKHDVDLPRERFMEPGYMGCGEYNPLEASAGALEANRRVTFFFFDPARLPNLPCAFADVAPCRRQMVSPEARHTPAFRCSFYDSLARSCPGEGPVRLLPKVYLLDAYGERIPHARWIARAGAGSVGDGVADATGLATLPSESLPDVIELEWGPPPTDGTVDAAPLPFSREYHLRASGAEQACQLMLSNLGFDRFDEIARNVADFQRELGRRVTGAAEEIMDVLEQWHATGNRPAAAGAPPGDDVDDDTADDTDDGASTAEEGEDGDGEEGVVLEEWEEPLHPADVLDHDHDEHDEHDE